MPCVSVIVPVYNAEAYLAACIESILDQTFSDLELILVDDASPDRSGFICDEYAKKDPRIRVIHKENEGPSVARNTGMDAACAEYVLFVDSDDYIEPDLLATVYPLAQERSCDVVMFGYFTDIEQNGKLTQSQEICSIESLMLTDAKDIAVLAVEWKRNFLFDTACNKLYRLSLIRENGIQMLTGELFEDTAFNLCVFPLITSMAVVNRCFYHYMQRTAQHRSNTYHPGKWEMLKARHLALLHYLKSFPEVAEKLTEKANYILIKYAFSCFIDAFLPASGYDGAKRKAYVAQTYRDPVFLDALDHVQGSSKMDHIIVWVAKTRRPSLIRFFSYGLYLAKYRYKRLFFFLKRI